MQCALFIAVGRIFDTGGDTITIQRVVDQTVENPQFFTQKALINRQLAQGTAPDVARRIAAKAWQPAGSDEFKDFRKKLGPLVKAVRTKYVPLRKAHYAHTLDISPQIHKLFSETSRDELGQILRNAYHLVQSFENLLTEGRKPDLDAGLQSTYLQTTLTREIGSILTKLAEKKHE